MICDGNTCGEERLDMGLYGTNDEEDHFIENLKHVKCKLIQLVREQLQTARNRQYTLTSMAGSEGLFPLERKHTKYLFFDELNENAAKQPATPHTIPQKTSPSPRRGNFLQRLTRIRRRICIIIPIVAIVALVFVLYFIYFRAYLCSKGQSCVTSFRYAHAKHTLF